MNTPVQSRTIGKVLAFSALVLAVAFLAPLLGGSPSRPGLGFVIWGMAPAIVAILLRTIGHDWSDSGFRPGLRKSWPTFALILLAVPFLMVLDLAIGKLSGLASVTGFSAARYFGMILPASGMFLVFAIFEELGWRGYLVPKLASLGINDFVSYTVVAVVWATWHMPYIRDLTWVYSTGNLLAFIPVFYLSMFAYSVLYYEIRMRTGSVWPAVLLHCLTNALQHPMAAEYLRIRDGYELLVSFTGVFMTFLVLAAGVTLRQIRVRKPQSSRFSR